MLNRTLFSFCDTLHRLDVLSDNSNTTPPELPSATRHRLIRSLDSWNFEPHKLPEEEILSCALILFELLFRIEGMTDQVGVSLGQFPPSHYHPFFFDRPPVCFHRSYVFLFATSTSDLPIYEFLS
jgi:hypothetical protein